jgi:hypothetical protein
VSEKKKAMTVKEAIKLLEAMPNKELAILIDCPYCGKGSQFAFVDECVVLRSKP